MNTKEAIEFLERLLTSDPYAEDIFLPIPKKDFTKINKLLREKMGYPLDRLSGNIGRELYKSLKNSKEINEIIDLLQQGEKYKLNCVEFKEQLEKFRKMYVSSANLADKFKAMWEELKEFYKCTILPLYTETFENIVNNVPLVGYKFYYYKTLETILNELEQKYFPKEAKQDNPSDTNRQTDNKKE